MKIEILRKNKEGKSFYISVRDKNDNVLEQMNYSFSVKDFDLLNVLKMHYSDLLDNDTIFNSNDSIILKKLKYMLPENNNISSMKTLELKKRIIDDVKICGKFPIDENYYNSLNNRISDEPFILNISNEKNSKKMVLSCSRIKDGKIIKGKNIIFNSGLVFRKDKIDEFFNSIDADFIGNKISINDSTNKINSTELNKYIRNITNVENVSTRGFNSKVNPGQYRNSLAIVKYNEYLERLNKELANSNNNVLYIDGGRKDDFNVSSYVIGNNNHYYGKSFIRKQKERNYEEFALLHGLKELLSKNHLLNNKTHIVCDYDELDWFYRNIKNKEIIKEKFPNVAKSIVYENVLELLNKPHKKIYIHFVKSHTKNVITPMKFGNKKVDELNTDGIQKALNNLSKLEKYADFHMTERRNFTKSFNNFLFEFRKRNKSTNQEKTNNKKEQNMKNNKDNNQIFKKVSFENAYGNQNLFNLSHNLGEDKSLVIGRYGNRCFEVHKIEAGKHTMEVYQRDFDNINPDDAIKDYNDFLMKHPIPNNNKLMFSVPDNYIQKSLGLTLRGLENKDCQRVAEIIYKYDKDNILIMKNRDWSSDAIEFGLKWYDEILKKSRDVKLERKRKNPKI